MRYARRGAAGEVRYARAYVDYKEHGDVVAMLLVILEIYGGGALVYTWFGGKRAPFGTLAVASVVWVAVLAVPFWFAPARALLAIASPTGVAVALARVGVLFLLIRGLAAARRKRMLFNPPRVRG